MSTPTKQQLLDFAPTESTIIRAAELLELNRQGRLSAELSQELGQFEQAELLMRLVKARIRSGQATESL